MPARMIKAPPMTWMGVKVSLSRGMARRATKMGVREKIMVTREVKIKPGLMGLSIA